MRILLFLLILIPSPAFARSWEAQKYPAESCGIRCEYKSRAFNIKSEADKFNKDKYTIYKSPILVNGQWGEVWMIDYKARK